MANSAKMAHTVARVMERDLEFADLDSVVRDRKGAPPVLPLAALAEWLGYGLNDPKFAKAVDRSKIALMNSGAKPRDHFFVDEGLFDGEAVTLHAALLVILNADPEKELVALAQNFFASRANGEIMEQEKRLKNRLEVVEENKRLHSAAKEAGVRNYGYFTAAGYRGMYGGRSIDNVAQMKGLKKGSDVLDYAGSEELAAHLFRITQTKAKLQREQVRTERVACATHEEVGRLVRVAIRKMGGTMPEQLPAASERIDQAESAVRSRLDQCRERQD